MKSLVSMRAAAILACAAGHALAGPVNDGTLAGDEGCYGNILWFQNQPTGFGDNRPENVPPSGDALTAFSGIELRIPLAALGNATGLGDIKLAGWVTSGDHTFMSNQVIGGLPNLDNLGATPDFSQISGDQFITITAATGGSPPIIDGFIDGVYGANQDNWAQNNWTGFGDAQHGNIDGGSGSEIDAVYAWTDGVDLYLLITGNLEANANGLNLFFDVVAGGQQVLASNNPVFDNPIDPNRTDVLNVQAGTTFDAGFEADATIFIAGMDVDPDDQIEDFRLAAHYATLPTGGGGNDFFLGEGTYASSGTLSGADAGAPDVALTIDNSNIDGVTGFPPIEIPSRDFAVGSEIDGLYGFIDPNENRAYILVTGNLETNFNKLVLFFDVDGPSNGQNTIRTDNVDIDFGALGNMASDGVDPGLTFDADFAADYFFNVGSGNSGPDIFSNSAVLRTNGAAFIGTAIVDYGSFSGGLKADNDPLDYNGPRLDGQDGTATSLFSEYPPRASHDALIDAINGGDPTNPIPPAGDLVFMSLDNSNIAGVTDTDASDAPNVITGVEIAIDLDELGWDGVSDVKVAGFIANSSHTFMSNQVIGGLPAGDNLGNTRAVDFSQIDGTQYVILPIGACDVGCPADLDGDGDADADDFFTYLDFFASGDPAADIDGDGDADADDFFAYLDLFAQGC